MLTRTNKAQRAAVAAATRSAIDGIDQAKRALATLRGRGVITVDDERRERHKLHAVRINIISANSRVMRLPQVLGEGVLADRAKRVEDARKRAVST